MKIFNFYNFLDKILFVLFLLAYFLIFFSFSTEGVNADGIHKKIFVSVFSISILITLMVKRLHFLPELIPLLILGCFIAFYNYYISSSENKFFLNIILGISISYLLVSFTYFKKSLVIKAIKTYIAVNIFFMTYQFIMVVLFGENLYLHGELFSFSRENYTLLESTFYRISGYQMEPGSCATLLILSTLNLYFLEKKVTKYTFFALFFSLITFSSIAVILCIFSIVILNKDKLKTSKAFIKLVIMFFIFIFALYFLGVLEYIIDRFTNTQIDNSTYYKISNMDYLLSKPIFEQVIGSGLGYIDSYCFSCGHLTGNGTLFYLVHGLGIMGIIIIIYPIFVVKDKSLALLVIALVSMTRFPVEYIQFWFFLFIFISVYRKSNSNV